MENRIVLADTSIIIEYLRKTDKSKSILINLLENGFVIKLSSITVFELFAGATSREKEIILEKLIKKFEIIDLTSDIARLSAIKLHELKKSNLEIEVVDIFIGVTAIHNNYALATLNKKHFERIEGIEIVEQSSYSL